MAAAAVADLLLLTHSTRKESPYEAVHQHDGLVAPMDRANVDTDLMVPKQFEIDSALTSVRISLMSCAIWMKVSPIPIIVRAPQLESFL